MKTYKGIINTKFYRIIPFVIGVSITKFSNKSSIYSLQITPFLEIMIGYKGTRHGCIEIKK